IFFVSVSMLVLFLGSFGFVREEISSGWTGTIQRLYGGEEETDIALGMEESFLGELEHSRGAEAMEFISRSTPYTWFFGNGWGGSWNSTVMAQGGDWYIVHIGPLHMVLKGGVLLAVFYL